MQYSFHYQIENWQADEMWTFSSKILKAYFVMFCMNFTLEVKHPTT